MKTSLKNLLYILRMIGVDPKNQGVVATILKITNTIGFSFLLAIYIMEFVLNWNGVKTLAKLYMFPALCMIVLKGLTLQRKNANLSVIIAKIEAFIPLSEIGGELENRLNKIFDRIESVIKIYIYFAMGVILVYSSTSLITKDRTLYFDGYHFCDIYTQPCFIYYFAYQNVIVLLVAMPIVMGFDCLFFYLITEAYCAFEVTKHLLKELGVDEKLDRKKLDKFVKQHEDTMQYVKELNRLYSTIMLAQWAFSTGGLLLSQYMTTSEGIPPPLPILLKYGMLYVFLATQFFFYCFGGSTIMEQSKSVADVAFDVDWWSQTRSELRKSLVLIIERSQRIEKISVGNVIDLNFSCFVQVLSNSFSAYTLLLAIEGNGN